MWFTVQYVLLLFSLSHCYLHCLYYSLSFLINVLCFFNVFLLCFSSSFVCFAFYFVFRVFVLFCVLFLPMYIVVYFLFVYNYTDHCRRVETQLQLINIISCHIMSNDTAHWPDLCHYIGGFCSKNELYS